MDYPKSVPGVGLVNGQFVDENPVTGTPGSLIPSTWGNAVTSEMLNVIAAAGMAPSEVDLTQLLKAIGTLGQSAASSFAIDTGTANTYVCNFTPAITTRVEGQPLRFKVKTANNGACTINDGLGVVAMVGGAHSALQGGELVANGDAWVQWNTSVGGGSYILLFCTGAAEQVANGTKSQHAVALGQVPTETLGGAALIATQALTNAGVNDTTSITPKKLLAWVASGVMQATETALGFLKVSTQALVNAGVDDTTAVTPKKLKNGFLFSVSSNGYIIFPSWLGGCGVQWGVVPSLASGTPLTLSLPITFANNTLWCLASGSDPANNNALACNAAPISSSSIRLAQSYGSAMSARYLVIGN